MRVTKYVGNCIYGSLKPIMGYFNLLILMQINDNCNTVLSCGPFLTSVAFFLPYDFLSSFLLPMVLIQINLYLTQNIP